MDQEEIKETVREKAEVANAPEAEEKDPAEQEDAPVELEAPESEGKKKKSKERKKYPLLAVILSAVCLAFVAAVITCQVTYTKLSQIYTKNLYDKYIEYRVDVELARKSSKQFQKLAEIKEIFEGHYIYDMDDDEISAALINTFFTTVNDKYARIYTAEEWAQEVAGNNGNSSGIGIFVSPVDEGILIGHVMKGSPAIRAGLLDGDIITKIDGESVPELGYNEAVNKVAGEIGTIVRLTVLRNGEDVIVPVERGTYEAETILPRVIERDGKKIGFVRITDFMGMTDEGFIEAVSSLLIDGCEGLIFDVRSNPGGELTTVVNMLDYLLPEGPIAHIKDGDGNEVRLYTSGPKSVDVPMVIITNGSTASAAELFTSAIRDYGKATIVGEKTYGKGCGQSGYSLSDGGMVYVTAFLYDPPFSNNYNGIGIYPDVEIALDEEISKTTLFLLEEEDDTQLQKAIEEMIKALTK